ncbi:MAG: hypothetical protein WC269_04790 [Candidatus Gracilibacteria bacterium]|jgi:hypothetical protein
MSVRDYDKACAIKQEFVELHDPYVESIHTCGVSKVEVKDPQAPPTEHGDYCISVGITVPLPVGISFPDTYRGMRVFVRLINPAVPQ